MTHTSTMTAAWRASSLALIAAFSVACGDAGPSADIAGADFAKGKPNLEEPQVCAIDAGGTFYTDLAAICADTEDPNTEFLSRNNADRDRWGLIGKLNRASTNCFVDGNAAGALDKVTDFRDKVYALRTDGKISEPEGVDLAGAAQALIDAFDPLLTPTPLTCPSGDPAIAG